MSSMPLQCLAPATLSRKKDIDGNNSRQRHDEFNRPLVPVPESSHSLSLSGWLDLLLLPLTVTALTDALMPISPMAPVSVEAAPAPVAAF